MFSGHFAMATKLFLPTLCLLCYTYMCKGQSGDRLSMTLLDRGPLQSELSTDSNNQYQCYVSHRDTTEGVASFRLGYTRDGGEASNPDPTDPVDDTVNIYPRWLVDLDVTNNNAFGVFGCIASRNGELATKVSTVRMRSDAKITPRDSLYTQTVNIGDEDIEIEMSVSQTEDLQWTKDNELLTSAVGMTRYRFNQPIEQPDAGIYELFMDGERNDALHGLRLLFVRACPAHRWNPPDCFGICDNCYNGGVCDEINGKCICSPGFRGTNCEIECGFNRFGEDCEFQCSSGEDNGDRCRGNLYCRPHPFGCTCISGFQGLGCQDDCSPGSYGASCLQTCHCANGGTCARETGICTAGCDNGWSGSNCQVPDTCPHDFYGVICTEKCHCKDAASCDRETGICSNGVCAPGYKVYDNNYCEECQGNSFGLDCSHDCHCSENSCNKITGFCSGNCTDEWVDLFSPNNCQTGLVSATFTTVNPGVAVSVHCRALEGPGGNLSVFHLVLSRDDDSLVDTGIQFHNTTYNDDDTSVSTFIVDNVNIGEVLYCQLRYEGEKRAVINVNITHFYKLPELAESPAELSSNGSSVTIAWTAWNENDNIGDGPVIGYIPYYRLHGGDWMNDIFNPEMITTFTFTGLDPETSYLFCVAAFRPGPQGEGPKSPELEVKTQCGVPKVFPVNLTAEMAGQRQEYVDISWQIPTQDILCTSGVTGVTVYYVSLNLKKEDKGKVHVGDAASTSVTLTGLQREGNYSIQMTLETSGGEGGMSDKIYHYVPMLPTLGGSLRTSNLACDSLVVEWDTWNEITDPGTPPIVSYIPYYKISSSGNWTRGETVPHDESKTKHSYTFRNLSESYRYKFAIAVAREGYGGEGDRFETDDKATCPVKSSSIGIIVGVSIGSVIVAGIFVFLIYRTRKTFICRSDVSRTSTNTVHNVDIKGSNNDSFSGYENATRDNRYSTVGGKNEMFGLPEKSNTNDEYEEPSSAKTELKATNGTKSIEFVGTEAATYQNITADESHTSRLPMKSSNFPIFMKSGKSKRKILADMKLLDQLIPRPTLNTLLGSSDVNLPKNRFANVIPLDESRPLLRSMCLTQGGNDYINASFVKIPSVTQTLILTQAPLRNTTEDFWRLVYDYNCRTIVMLNDTSSEDKTAVRYWPELDDIIFGTMTVSTTSIEKKENYTIHQCNVLHQSFKEPLKVNRFVFKTWPKKDENLSSLVDFMSVVRFGSAKNGVVLIHCINGVDRSGVYAVVCAEINRNDENQTINVFETIKSVKLSNPSALKKKEDYLLCYQLLNCYLTDHDAYAAID